jgi:hypothetical protein
VIKLSSAFELAYARWCGEQVTCDVGPMKAPAPAARDDLDRAFGEWECEPRDPAPRDTTPRCRSR